MTDHESPFVEAGIDPILADAPHDMQMAISSRSGADRPDLRVFISQTFRRHHGARITHFYPNLIDFRVDDRLLAVVGYRDGHPNAFFAEHYLPVPADRLASERLGQPVAREELVEVGNLAISDPGQARWIISASTEFLASAGYRWVLFTANKPLANAFSRLGLKPLPLAEADPARLPDGGASWGDYYTGKPQVYLGDIHAGCSKLRSHARRHAPLGKLLLAARDLATRRPFSGMAATGTDA